MYVSHGDGSTKHGDRSNEMQTLRTINSIEAHSRGMSDLSLSETPLDVDLSLNSLTHNEKYLSLRRC